MHIHVASSVLLPQRRISPTIVFCLGVTMLQSGGELVHVPMSLRARTATQGESEPTHVPMSPLGEDRCIGEGARMNRNSLEESGRFQGIWRFLERCYRKVPEEWVYREERYSTCLIYHPALYSGFRSVTPLCVYYLACTL